MPLPGSEPPRIFVAGTDTGVGKTEAACALLSLWARAGARPVPFKPYESGCSDVRRPADALALRRAAQSEDALERICVHRFRAPLAPGVAAAREGRRPSYRKVLDAYRSFKGRALVVEGAGGLRVPLDGRHDVLDLIETLWLPVLLVARAGLGTLNHTALSLDALSARRIRVRGVLLVQTRPSPDPSVRDNPRWLAARHGVQVFGPVPYERRPAPRRRAFEAALSASFRCALLLAMFTAVGARAEPPVRSDRAEEVMALKEALANHGGAREALRLTELGRLGFEALADSFSSPSLTESKAQVLLEAFRDGGAGIEASVPVLRGVLEDAVRPSFVRAYAVASLGEVGPAAMEAAPALRGLLRDPSPLVQQAALDALSQLGDRTIVPLLLERIHAEEWSARLAAFMGLSHLGPIAREAVGPLLAELASSDFEQRALSAEALGWIHDARAIPGLVRLLDGNSWSAAEQAAHSLGRLGARSALPKLRETQKRHWYRRVRQASSAAIADIQASVGKAVPRHDFRAVDSARRIQAALSSSPPCQSSPDGGWSTPQLTPPEELPALLPSVLPPLRLGRDEGFRERMRGHPVSDGWLVARDAGEWGGALWFVGWDGRKSKLTDQPVEGFVDVEGGVLALGGVPHRSRSAGVVWRLTRSAEGIWSAEPLAELPGSPLAWRMAGSGAVVIATTGGTVELNAAGSLRELACDAH